MPPNPVLTNSQFDPERALQISRFVGSVFGFILIILGLVFVVQVFILVQNNITQPDELQLAVKTWLENVDGTFEIRSNGETIVSEQIIVLIIVIMLLSLLIQISLGIISAGVKLISSTTSEREAVKRILEHSMGKK